MSTLAKQFVEELAQAVNDLEKTQAIDLKYKDKYKLVKFVKYNKKGFRFVDGSALFFGAKEGSLELPEKYNY